MMTTQMQKAVLLDLHSSTPSHSPSLRNHINLVKTSLHDVLLNDHTSCDVTQLYVLTSSTSDVSNASDQSDFREDQIHASVVGGDHRIASFYRAKQNLDNLDISSVTVLCDARAEQFWTYVCQDLFTPVHEWEVKVVEMPAQTERAYIQKPDRAEDKNHVTQTKLSNREYLKTKSSKRRAESSIYDSFNTNSSTHDTFQAETSNPDVTIHQNSETKSSIQDASDAELRNCTAESVRAEIRTFLKTLPSFLGMPEAERSQLLPGEEEGFVHGYSTRRGGVTSLPTLCAMNTMYTDKKRDSRLVVEENLRRLSLVGGFDPQTFHIVRVEHGHRVWTVGEEEPPIKYDALITNRRDVTIAAAGADCIPLLFADPVAMAIGAAHAGWLGSVERVAEYVVKTMGERFGSRPEDIRVSMGPGVRLGCFIVLEEEGKMFAQIHPSCQVDSVETVSHRIDKDSLQKDILRSCEVQEKRLHGCDDQILQELGTLGTEKLKTEIGKDCDNNKESKTPVLLTQASEDDKMTSFVDCKTSPSTSLSKHLLKELRVEQVPAEHLKPKTPRERKSSRLQWTFVDLQMTNYHVLLQAGVKAEHIDMSTSHCTKCNPDLYFSYERDGFPFGNQIGFICMPSGSLEV